jgi:hypothetical protein
MFEAPAAEMRNNGARRSPWRVGASSSISPTFFSPLQKNFLRRRVAWVAIGADRFQAEGDTRE